MRPSYDFFFALGLFVPGSRWRVRSNAWHLLALFVGTGRSPSLARPCQFGVELLNCWRITLVCATGVTNDDPSAAIK